MKNEISPDLLRKYLRGETTQAETALVDEWYSALQENADDVGLLDPLELHFVQHRIYDRIREKIEVPLEVSTNKRRRFQETIFKSPFKLAAAITAIAVISIGAIFLSNKRLPYPLPANIAENKVFEKLNDSNTTEKVVLPDGTTIILKPNSSIEYPEQFASNERRVHLSGEAFFDVTKDPK